MSPTVVRSILFSPMLALAGCWTAPVANVQPKGESRLIQSGVEVRSVRKAAIVKSVDAGTRTIVVLAPGQAKPSTYKVAPGVSNLDRLRAGDRVEATVAEELAVYLLVGDQLLTSSGAPETISVDARVLSVDPSYRLLSVQYPDGRHETFKVGLRVRLEEMQSGDSIVIRTREVVGLRVSKF
jgi:hypothetical protein